MGDLVCPPASPRVLNPPRGRPPRSSASSTLPRPFRALANPKLGAPVQATLPVPGWPSTLGLRPSTDACSGQAPRAAPSVFQMFLSCAHPAPTHQSSPFWHTLRATPARARPKPTPPLQPPVSSLDPMPTPAQDSPRFPSPHPHGSLCPSSTTYSARRVRRDLRVRKRQDTPRVRDSVRRTQGPGVQATRQVPQNLLRSTLSPSR
jgi:hypothetical protein